jgi:rhodanese-related sulfurtransferase
MIPQSPLASHPIFGHDRECSGVKRSYMPPADASHDRVVWGHLHRCKRDENMSLHHRLGVSGARRHGARSHQEVTVSIQQLTADQAQAQIAQDQTIIYLDVRTVPEFEAGHPPAALNIPVVIPNPALRKMVPNPDFLATVEGTIPKDAKVIIGCMSGGRSQFAAEVLEEAGYQHIANLQGGFGGARDQMGRLLVPGWQDHGLPEEASDGGEGSYENLSKRR